MARSKSIWIHWLVEEVEVRALLWVLSVVKDIGWPNIKVEGDCKNIIDALNVNRKRNLHVYTFIDNCLSFLQIPCYLSFRFCYRECDMVAHGLARRVVSGISDEVWVSVSPTWLKDALYSDLILFES